MARSKILSNAPADKVFWVCDGRIVKNLYELVTALNTMSDETYKFHASKWKNDFADWALKVFGSKKIYLQIKDMRKRERVAQYIKKLIEEEKAKKKKRKIFQN